MIFGVDVSSYQSTESIDGYDFAIMNVRDPDLGNKVNRAISLGITWGVYEWINPGTGAANANQLLNVAGNLPTRPPLGYWFDYEQANVTPDDLNAAFMVMNNNYLGSRTGYYSNAGTVDHQLFLDYPWWYAAYPGANDGSFPGFNQMANPMPRHAVIWQYSSTNGTLDKDVVVDEAWYATWNFNNPIVQEDTDMPYIAYGPVVGYLGSVAVPVLGAGQGVGPERWNGNEDQFGIPADAKTWNDKYGRNLKFLFLDEGQMKALLSPMAGTTAQTIPTHITGTITGTLQ